MLLYQLLEMGTWEEGVASYKIMGKASVNPDQTYGIQVKLEGELNQSVPTNFTLYVVDDAGNVISKNFELYCDLEPPKLVDIEVR